MGQSTTEWVLEHNLLVAPVVLFVYNRPDHTRATVEALKRNYLSPDTILYIYADGPKNDAAQDRVQQVRDYLRQIDGFKQIVIIERQGNYGLARNVIEGVSEVVNRHQRVIVIEDDLVTSPYFLQYMNIALAMYQNQDKVMQISGHMFPIDDKSVSDTFFLPMTTSWGWGTWQRAWSYFDPEASGTEILLTDAGLRRRFNLNDSYDYTTMMFRQKRQEINSWAIRWYWTMFKHNGLTLYPKRTMVHNTGMDGSGTHCGVNPELSTITEMITCPLEIKYTTPIVDEKSFLKVQQYLKGGQDNVTRKLYQLIRRVVGR